MARNKIPDFAEEKRRRKYKGELFGLIPRSLTGSWIFGNKIAFRITTNQFRVASRCADPAEKPCVRRDAVRRSQRNEHICAFDKSRTRVYCDLRFRGICLGARAECLSAIASPLSHRCESGRAQLRGDNDRLGQLRSCSSSATGQRSCSVRSLFQNSGVDSALGRIAVSWRVHLRARAAGSLDHLVDRAVPARC